MDAKCDTLVIGGGLFGSVIARTLHQLGGQHVTIFDRAHKDRGSRPAACLMKPSWLGAFSRGDQKAQLGLLDELYDLQTVAFTTTAGIQVPVHWVPPSQVLSGPTLQDDIRWIEKEGDSWLVVARHTTFLARRVVVAAGVWTSAVLGLVCSPAPRRPTVQAQAGQALLYPGCHIDQPFIRPWAPYKQVVAFNRGDGLWVGDGSSIREMNWDESRAEQSEDRCAKAVLYRQSKGVSDYNNRTRLYGLRPYVRGMDGNPAYLDEAAPGLWVATGGAKNGTMGAAWCALRLLEKLS